MKWVKVALKYLSLAYLIISVFQAVVFPRNFLGQIDNLLFIFAFIYVIEIIIKNKQSRWFFLGFILMFSWSFLVQFINHPGSIVEHFSVNLVFIKWGVILICAHSFSHFEEQSKYWINGLNTMFLTLVAINLWLVINPFGTGLALQHLYTASEFSDFEYFNDIGAFRLSGTQLNPNDNAIIWGCFILYFTFFIKKYWVQIILAVGMLILTQSRTIVIAIVFIYFLYFIIPTLKQLSVKRFVLGLITVVVGGALIVISSPYLQSIFTGEAFSSKSFLIRISNYTTLTDLSFNELMFGKGIISNPIEALGFSMDSEYLGLILQYGILGLITWGFLIYTLIKVGGRRNQFLNALIILIIVTSFTNYTLLNLQAGVVLCFFLGLAIPKNMSNK